MKVATTQIEVNLQQGHVQKGFHTHTTSRMYASFSLFSKGHKPLPLAESTQTALSLFDPNTFERPLRQAFHHMLDCIHMSYRVYHIPLIWNFIVSYSTH